MTKTKAKPKPTAPAVNGKPAGRKVRPGRHPVPRNAVDEAVAVLTEKVFFKRWNAERLREAVISAIRLHGADDRSEADTLEAWLLTGLSLDRVAAKTDLPADVVTVYAARYFDHARRLGTDRGREELAWELFGYQGLYGFPEQDTGSWKRLLGLTGGEHVLAGYLEYLEACPLVVPGDLTTLSDAELERLKSFLWTRILTLGDQSDWTDAQKRRFEVVMARREYLGV